jgi:hypothetical protein
MLACGPSTVTTPLEQRPPSCNADLAPGGDGLRLLFIGNSLTYTYDIPGIVALLFENSGIDFARIETVANPNYGLPDHWVSPVTQSVLAQGWDLVVLQPGPSATEGRPYLLEYAAKFAEKIRAGGGLPALYMVWPAEARSFDFDGVSDSYETAAELVDGYLFPVGEAWLSVWARNPDIALYGPDRFHPSVTGSYLAAVTIFEQLAGMPAPDPPADFCVPGFGELGLPREIIGLLRNAAAEANENFARVPADAKTR